MAKFRRQHTANRKGRLNYFGRSLLVILIFASLLIGIFYLSQSSFLGLIKDKETHLPDYQNPTDRFYLPTVMRGRIIHHKYYSLSYDENAEQAEWVAYYLTKESLKKPNVPRAKRFKEDNSIDTKSATYFDYRGSGFDRGHLVPAADMAFDHQAMQETFLMSNISPQVKAFNGGIWKELEENVRDWAFKNDGLYICTGPVFGKRPSTIGQSRIWIPDFFYKVLLDLESNSPKAIAFILPNKISYEPLMYYAVSVDALEERTGFNFFDNLLEDEEENKIESTVDQEAWPVSQKRFNLRNTKWNRFK